MFREWNIWSKIHLNIGVCPLLLMLVHVLNPAFGDLSQHKISSLVVRLHFFSSFTLLGDQLKTLFVFFKLILNIVIPSLHFNKSP